MRKVAAHLLRNAVENASCEANYHIWLLRRQTEN